MPDYKNGKIYKIVDNTNDNIYIGSTTIGLAQRLAGHRYKYASYCNDNSKTYIRSYDILINEDFDIILIENYPCNNKEELHKRERHYIETIKCVNKAIPTRTKYEWEINQKLTNTVKYKEAVAIKNKIQYDKNLEKSRNRAKEYRENNKDKIEAYKKQKHDCCCGGHYTNDSKATHMKSKKHIAYLGSTKN